MFDNKERDREIKYLKEDVARLKADLLFISRNLDSVAKAVNLQWVPATEGHYAEKGEA